MDRSFNFHDAALILSILLLHGLLDHVGTLDDDPLLHWVNLDDLAGAALVLSGNDLDCVVFLQSHVLLLQHFRCK